MFESILAGIPEPTDDDILTARWKRIRRECESFIAMIDVQHSIPAMLESLATPGEYHRNYPPPVKYHKIWLLHRALERGASRDQCREALFLLFQRARPKINAARAKLTPTQSQYIHTFNYGIAQDLLHHVQITAIELALLTKQEVQRHHFPTKHPFEGVGCY